MKRHKTEILGKRGYDQIALFARKRFVDGYDTISLLKMAKSDLEREEIILVSLLDIDDNQIKKIKLCCKHLTISDFMEWRDQIRKMLEQR